MTPEKLAQLQENRGFLKPDFERRRSNIASDFEFASKINPEESQEELDGRMARILSNTEKGDPAADPMLKAYRKYREGRGEKPLQYLDSYNASNRSKKLGEQIPFFAKMFTDFPSAFPPERRAAVEADFANSPRADLAKKATANKMLVAAMTDQPVESLERSWPVMRTMYAKQALGWDKDGVITEEEFHGLAGSMLQTEEKNRKTTTEIANRARASIIKGEDSEKLIKGLPAEYQQVARQVQTDFLAKFDDEEIALAKALFQRDIAEPSQREDDNAEVDLEGVYNSLSIDRKDAVRGLMGILAEDHGWDVQGFFARTYASTKEGAVRVARGAASTNEEGRAEFLDWYAQRGTIFTPEELKDPKVIDHLYDSWIGLRRGGPGAIEAYEKDVAAKTPEGSKEFLASKAKSTRSRAAYLADMATAGIHTDRFMREQEDGFWMKSWLLASGSLAETGLAVLPAGTGLPIIMGSRKAEAKSNFQRIAPNADPEQIESMATLTALGQTATLGLERFILGARLPKTTRSLAALEHGITNMALRGGWRTAVAAAPRIGLVIGLEMIQENVENMIPHMVQALASGLSEDIPGVNWDKVFKDQKEIQDEIFGASVIFGIIGGGGRTVADAIQGPKLREALMDTAGMRLSGMSPQDASDINALAERNPLDAAEEYQRRMAATPDDVKRANVVAERVRQAREANDGETMRRAGLPQMTQNEDGRVTVKWNDIMDNESVFSTPEEAQQAMSQREAQAATDLSRMNRQDMLDLVRGDAEAEIARLQAGLPSNVRLETKWVESQTFAEWAGNDTARIGTARERIRLYMQSARNDMGAVIPDSEIDLNEWFYQGSSRNIYEGGITTIAVELVKGGKTKDGRMTDPASALTVLEEVAEGLSKHFRSQGVTLQRQFQWVRTIENNTGIDLLPHDFFTGLSEEAQALAVDEALSDIAMSYAIGRVADENVPSGLLSFLKAFKELFGAVMRLAKGISNYIKEGGTIDADFQQFLDTAAGLTEPTAVAEAEVQAVEETASQAEAIAREMLGEGRTFAVQPQNVQLVEGEPLRGLSGPTANINVPGRGMVKFGPFETARRAAKAYVESAGLVYDPPGTYAKVNKARAERIAAEFDAMKHDPQDPEVKASYDAMIRETLAQWEAIKATGLKVEVNPPGVDPYAASPRLAILDVIENNHLYFFPTFEGFGSSDADISGNPLLQETGEVLEGGHVMVANDVFRIVHDYFGHIKEGVGFRADGEENAWRSHSAMYSPLARRAMTTETRGQNSWVNFGPHGEANRKAGAGETVFADQKIGLLPEWVSYEAAGDPSGDIALDVARGNTTIEGTSFAIRAWHGSPHVFSEFSTDYMGTGEGFQAKGWGLYIAESKQVGEYYREALAPPPEIRELRIGGVPIYVRGNPVDYSPYQFTSKPTDDDYARTWLQETLLIYDWQLKEAYSKGGMDSLVKKAQQIVADTRPDDHTQYDAFLKVWENRLKHGIGNRSDIDDSGKNLYEVELRFDPEDAFHFDLPFKQQGKSVQKALLDSGIWEDFHENSDALHPQWSQGIGERIYNFLSKKLGGDREASLRLASIGIPALAHFNGATVAAIMANQATDTSNNYVVFDGKSIDIKARNGKPVMLPALSFAISPVEGLLLFQAEKAGADPYFGELPVGVDNDVIDNGGALPIGELRDKYLESSADYGDRYYENFYVSESYQIDGTRFYEREQAEAYIEEQNEERDEDDQLSEDDIEEYWIVEDNSGSVLYEGSESGAYNFESDSIYEMWKDDVESGNLDDEVREWAADEGLADGDSELGKFLSMFDGLEGEVSVDSAGDPSFEGTFTRGDITYELEVSLDDGDTLNVGSLLPKGDNRASSDPISLEFITKAIIYGHRFGIRKVKTTGARSDEKGGMTGYLTWPRFGFDLAGYARNEITRFETLADTYEGSEQSAKLRRMIELAMPEGSNPSLLTLLSTREGLNLWRQYGSGVQLEFHLTPGSPNVKRFVEVARALGSRAIARGAADEIPDPEAKYPIILRPDTTFAVASATGKTLVEHIESQISDPGTKSRIWQNARDRIADINDRYADKPNPSRWISVEEQELELLDIDERRTAEFERHDSKLTEIEANLGMAQQEARSGLMAELGNRFEEAGASHRNTLRRLTRERENTVRQKYLRQRDAENVAHKRNLAALDSEEKALMDRGRATDRERNRFQQIKDIATLEAIGKSLPAAIRGLVVPSFKKITDMTKAADREAYIRDLVPKLDQAIEKHLKREFDAAITKRLKSGQPVTSDSRTATGKIGARGHDLFRLAESAKSIKPEDLDARTQEIQDKIDAMPNVDLEALEDLDTEMAIIEAFYDYDNASSYRLEKALELMDEIYVTGRREWLDTLAARKERTQYIVSTLAAGLGVDEVQTADRVAAVRASEGIINRISEGFMAALLSGHQTIRRLGELTDDVEVKAVLETFERDLYDAETAEQDGVDRDQRALATALRDILKVSTDYAMAKKLRELTEGSPVDVPVTKVVGATEDAEIKVPIKYVESIVRGETQGWTPKPRKNQIGDPQEVSLTDEQVDLLRQAWFDFQLLDEEERKGQRSITITSPGAKGVRKSLGKLAQLEGLQFLLTLQQPDQVENAKKIGYDETTVAELKAWLKPEVQAIGDWMVDYLRADQGIVDAIHRAEKGVGLGLVENYFPIRKDVAGADLGNLDLNGMGAQQGGRSVGFIKARVDNRADIAIANALGVFMAHRAQVNFWKSHVAPIRVWGTIIKNEAFAGAVRSRMGETYYKALSRMMKRVEAGGRLNAQQQMDFERVVKGLMRNFAVGTLGARLSTLMVNTSAVLNSTFEVPAGELLKGASLVLKRPQAFADAWNSPPIQRRLQSGSSFEAQLAKSKGPSDNPVLAVLNRAAEPGMNAINRVDTTANVVGAVAAWEFHRQAAERAGLNPEQAKRMADEKIETILRRAAQPTTRISKSEVELLVLDNPMSAMLAMFISEPRKNMAIIFMAARKVLTGVGSVSKGMAAQQLLTGLVAYTMAEFVLRSAYSAFFQAKPEDEDEAWKRLTDKLTDPKAIANKLAVSHIGGIPILGQGWQYAMAKVFDQPAFDDSNNPFIRVGKSLEKVTTVADSDKTASERIDGMLKIVQGIGSAVPGGPVFSQAANILDAATGALESNGVSFSEASTVDKYKGRFAAENKEITKLYGKTDGNKAIAAKKHEAQVEALVSMLQPLTKAEAEKILEAVNVSEDVVNRVKRRLGKR